MLSASLNKTFLFYSILVCVGAGEPATDGVGHCPRADPLSRGTSPGGEEQTGGSRAGTAAAEAGRMLCINQMCQLVRFIRKPYGFLQFARAYGHTMQSLRIFMIFEDSHLQSFHALDSNCCEVAVTRAMLHEANHATAAYNREHENKLSVSQQVVFCLLLYMGVLQQEIPMTKLCFVMVLTSCKDFFADCKDFLS